MVKALDPNIPGMREAVQQVVTADFAELVKTYPNVAFHHGSQRLALGSPDGITSIYDLKTATRVQVLEVCGFHFDVMSKLQLKKKKKLVRVTLKVLLP
jgi:WD40 repeat protein